MPILSRHNILSKFANEYLHEIEFTVDLSYPGTNIPCLGLMSPADFPRWQVSLLDDDDRDDVALTLILELYQGIYRIYGKSMKFSFRNLDISFNCDADIEKYTPARRFAKNERFISGYSRRFFNNNLNFSRSLLEQMLRKFS